MPRRALYESRVTRPKWHSSGDLAGRWPPVPVSRLDLVVGPNGAGKTTLYDVPAEKLQGCFERLWLHVVAAVPYCHRVIFYDNSYDSGPAEVGSHRYVVADYQPRWPDWAPVPLLDM